jgi:hypothetical protein
MARKSRGVFAPLGGQRHQTKKIMRKVTVAPDADSKMAQGSIMVYGALRMCTGLVTRWRILKCNAQRSISFEIGSVVSDPSFFTFFCPQGKFLRHYTKTVALLHFTIINKKYFKKLSQVKRRVKRSATECNGSATETNIPAFHFHDNRPWTSLYSQKVQECNAKSAPNNFSEVNHAS